MPGREPLSSIVNLEALQAQVDSAIGMIQKMQGAIDEVRPLFDNYKSSTGGKKQQEDTDALTNSLKQLTEAQKQLDAEKQKGITLESEVAKNLAIQKELNKQKATDMRAEAREAAGLNDAYRKLELQYNAAQRAAKNLAATPGTPQSAIDEANKKALALSNQLKAIDAAVGQHQRKVGDYVGAISILDKTLQETKNNIDRMGQAQQQNAAKANALLTELNQLTVAGQENSKAYLTMKAELDQLNQSEARYQAQQSELVRQSGLLSTLLAQQEKGFSSVTMEIRANERALFSLKEAGLQDSAAFKEIQKSVAAAHRELNEFNKGQQILESAEPGLKAATIAARGLAGAYATGAGAAALFADGDEKVQKELNKLVAVMTIMQGLQEASELLHQRTAVAVALETTASRIGAAAQRIWTATMLESTAATVAFRTVLITLTGGLLLLAPLLAYAVTNVSTAQEDAAATAEALNEVNKKAIDTYAGEIVQVKIFEERLKDANISRKDKIRLIDEEKQKYPEHLGNIKNEGELTTGLANAITNDLIPALEDEAKAKAAQELASDEYKKVLEAEQDLAEVSGQKWTNVFKMIASQATLGFWKPAFIKDQEAIDEGNKKIEAYLRAGLKIDEKNHKPITDHQLKFDPTDITKEIEAHQKLVDLKHKLAIAETDILADDKDAAAGTRIKAVEASYAEEKDMLHDRLKTQLEVNAIALQIEKARLAHELQDAKKTSEEKAVLISKSIVAQNALEDDRKVILLNSQDDLEKAEVKAQIKIGNIRAEELAKLQADEKATTEALAEAWEKYWESREATMKRAFDVNKNALSESRDYSLAALERDKAAAVEKGEWSVAKEKQYADQKKKIIADAIKYELEAQLKMVEAQRAAAIQKNGSLAPGKQIDTTSFDAQIAKIKLDLQTNADQQIFHSADELSEKKKKLQAKEVETAKAAEATITDFVKAGYEKQIQFLEKKAELTEKNSEKEKKALDDSSLSSQQKAAAEHVLAQRAAQEQAQIRHQIILEKQREAKFDREKAIFDIGANTAQSIIKTNAELGLPAAIPFDILAAAEGATQLAAVLSKTPPKYAIGTSHASRGFGIWGEAGLEAKIDRSGQVHFADRPTLSYMHGGEKIISNKDLNQIMYQQMLRSTANLYAPNQDESIQELRSMNRKLNNKLEWLADQLLHGMRDNRPIYKQPRNKDWEDNLKKLLP